LEADNNILRQRLKEVQKDLRMAQNSVVATQSKRLQQAK